MPTGASHHATGPAWTTCLGIIAVLFGALFTAAQGNELLLQAVIAPGTAAAQNIPADCREDEAKEEGVSVAECELMVANVRIMIASRPDWFRGVQMGLALVGAFVAFGSILVGVALVDARSWAPGAAVVTFGTLLALDGAGFAAALYTGPLLRALYLWNILLWFSIHLCVTAGAVAGRTQPSLRPAQRRLHPDTTSALQGDRIRMAHRDFRATLPLIHALIAVSIFFVLVSSWWMMALPLPSKVFTYRVIPFQLHKNVGLTVVVLVVVLLYARVRYLLTARTPRSRLRGVALVQNVLLYVLVLACCLSGYLSSAYSGWATRLWWLVDLPNWGTDNDELNILYSDIHSWTYYALLAIIAVHVGNAVYHAFLNDGVVRRMIRL